MTEVEKNDIQDEDINLSALDELEEVDPEKAIAEAKKWKSIAQRKDKKLRELEQVSKTITHQEERPAQEQVPSSEYQELRHDGYTKDEANFILANGGREALADKESFVAVAIETRREKQRAIDEASKVPEAQGSDIERRYTQAELSAMSADELEKVIRSQ